MTLIVMPEKQPFALVFLIVELDGDIGLAFDCLTLNFPNRQQSGSQ